MVIWEYSRTYYYYTVHIFMRAIRVFIVLNTYISMFFTRDIRIYIVLCTHEIDRRSCVGYNGEVFVLHIQTVHGMSASNENTTIRPCTRFIKSRKRDKYLSVQMYNIPRQARLSLKNKNKMFRLAINITRNPSHHIHVYVFKDKLIVDWMRYQCAQPKLSRD